MARTGEGGKKNYTVELVGPHPTPRFVSTVNPRDSDVYTEQTFDNYIQKFFCLE